MSIDSVLRLPDPPDLLRRFVDTRLQKVVTIDGKRVLVQSNHQGCLEMLSIVGPSDADGNCELKWTMVCDPELPAELGEASLVESAPVVLLSFGRACFMALHRNQLELTGFVSSGVDEASFREVILPRVRELIRGIGVPKSFACVT
jgi:hypothetical protein